MFKHLRTVAVAGLLGTFAALSAAGPAEVATSATSQASAVAVKVEGAVKHGAKTAASAVEHGVRTAASAVEHGASVAATAVERTAHRLGLPASSASTSK